MGVLREGINEVIATTLGNAAPIGIIHRDGGYHIVLYKGSHTAGNIRSGGWVVANLTRDPLLYVITAFEDLPADAFVTEQAGAVQVSRLKECDAWVAFTAVIEQETAQTLSVRLEPVSEQVLKNAVEPVNRGFSGIIEMTVHATRYIVTHNPQLRDLILHHAAVVRKCGGHREQEALFQLATYLRERKAPIRGICPKKGL